jgi:4-hydroxy-tetrahydrodipicolinate synthase
MIQGSIVAIVTPMLADGSLDKAALQQLIEYHIANATDAIVAVGTTGESATLSSAEHCQVIQWTVETVAKRIPVIAGTGSNATSEAIEFTRCAHEAGADAALLVTPYYNKPTQEGLYLHFKAVAEAVPMPQILYNVPGRTACDLQPETVIRLAQIDNIVGIKDATADLSRVAKHRAGCGDDFALYSGDDATALDFILQGGNGVISVTTNVAAQAMHDMCAAALQGDKATASALNDKLMGLHSGLFVEANPIPVKWAVETLNLIPANGGIRLPLTRLSEAYHQDLRQALRAAGVM